MTNRTLIRILCGLALLAVPALAAAQTPTPEGTVITNTATVSFSDANGNTYTPVSASVSVTVGYGPGVDVVATVPLVSPVSGSGSQTMTFTVRNIGNGSDSFVITHSALPAGVITVTGFSLDGGTTWLADLAALNTALAAAPTAPLGTVTITVRYDVAASTGGSYTDYTLTATTVRGAPPAADSDVTRVAPTLAGGVEVTPKGPPSGARTVPPGTSTFTFTVTNLGDGTDGFDLVASVAGATLTIVSVNGVPGSTTSISGVASGASRTIDVVYSIGGAVPDGTTDQLRLTATSQGDPTKSDQGFADITVGRPNLTIDKEVFRDDRVTTIGGSDTVVPTEFIQYRITVTNAGTVDATSVQVADDLPAELTYDTMQGDAAGWTFGGSGNNRTATLTSALAPGASRFFWIRVQVK